MGSSCCGTVAASEDDVAIDGGGGVLSTDVQKTLEERVYLARQLFDVYDRAYVFPKWSLELLQSGALEGYCRGVTAFYRKGDDLDLVQKIAREREPCNIAMRRLYDGEKLENLVGYRVGAYTASSENQLMPNIAIYCQTPMKLGEQQTTVHVINVIGYAFDSKAQPDFMYFFKGGQMSKEKWDELVERMSMMWRYIFECATRNKLRYVYLADVGGGAFSEMLKMSRETSYSRLKQESLPPVIAAYPKIEVKKLERIPQTCFAGEMSTRLNESLLVNAWDPWSMVGNGNEGDRSLDGFFGRCTAMALLCWPPVNPSISYVPVG